MFSSNRPEVMIIFATMDCMCGNLDEYQSRYVDRACISKEFKGRLSYAQLRLQDMQW